jgi:hypothetical protein
MDATAAIRDVLTGSEEGVFRFSGFDQHGSSPVSEQNTG